MDPVQEFVPLDGTVAEKEWLPTRLQVSILRAQSLQAKGRSGFSNPYVVVQLRKQKFVTSVVHHDLSPEWKESCLLKLPQGLHRWEKASLILTVKHHSRWFSDQFLGQIRLPLKQLFQEETRRNNE